MLFVLELTFKMKEDWSFFIGSDNHVQSDHKIVFCSYCIFSYTPHPSVSYAPHF